MKVGTLVKIKEDTDDKRLPENRMGIIVNVEEKELYHIRFINGNTLMFHKNFIHVINEDW